MPEKRGLVSLEKTICAGSLQSKKAEDGKWSHAPGYYIWPAWCFALSLLRKHHGLPSLSKRPPKLALSGQSHVAGYQYGVLGLLEDTLVTHLCTRGERVSSWSPLYVPCPLQWGLSWLPATGLGNMGSARALAENACGTEQGGTHSTGEEAGQANLPASQGRRHAGHSRFQQAAPGGNFSLEFA